MEPFIPGQSKDVMELGPNQVPLTLDPEPLALARS